MAAPPSGIPGPPPRGPPPPSLAILVSQNPVFVGVTTMLLVLCIAAVSLRLLARSMRRVDLGADDYVALVSLGIFIGLAIEQYLLAYYTTQIASRPEPPFQAMVALAKLEYASSLTGISLYYATKFSVLLLYRRVFTFQSMRFRQVWYACALLVTVLFTAFFFLNVAACGRRPITTFWREPGKCPPISKSASAQGFTNAAEDIILLALPIRAVWGLHMSQRMKVGVGAIFALGFIGVAVGIARAVYITKPDIFSDGGLTFIIWSTTDPAVALICACLPVLPPVLAATWKKARRPFYSVSRTDINTGARESDGGRKSMATLHHEMCNMPRPTPEEHSLSQETLYRRNDLEEQLSWGV